MLAPPPGLVVATGGFFFGGNAVTPRVLQWDGAWNDLTYDLLTSSPLAYSTIQCVRYYQGDIYTVSSNQLLSNRPYVKRLRPNTTSWETIHIFNTGFAWLVVHNGLLHLIGNNGTTHSLEVVVWDGTTIISDISPPGFVLSGTESAIVSSISGTSEIIIGEAGFDAWATYSATDGLVFRQENSGSCIFDMKEFEGFIHSANEYGYTYLSIDGRNWLDLHREGTFGRNVAGSDTYYEDLAGQDTRPFAGVPNANVAMWSLFELHNELYGTTCNRSGRPDNCDIRIWDRNRTTFKGVLQTDVVYQEDFSGGTGGWVTNNQPLSPGPPPVSLSTSSPAIPGANGPALTCVVPNGYSTLGRNFITFDYSSFLVSPNTEYTVLVSVACSDINTTSARINVYQSDGIITTFLTNSLPLDLQNQFFPLEVTFTTNNTASTLLIDVTFLEDSTTTWFDGLALYLDTVSVYEVTGYSPDTRIVLKPTTIFGQGFISSIATQNIAMVGTGVRAYDSLDTPNESKLYGFDGSATLQDVIEPHPTWMDHGGMSTDVVFDAGIQAMDLPSEIPALRIFPRGDPLGPRGTPRSRRTQNSRQQSLRGRASGYY